MSPDRGWKKAERMIAKDCGGQRIPVTGERDGSDVDHPVFCFQLKVRRALPAWLFTWLGGIVATAQRKHRIGVLVLNLPRRPRRHALVIVRWEDWVSLHGSVPVTSADTPEDQLTAMEGGKS
jgi:hypothetical protein